MSRTFGADNAIGWVQVRLRGGPRTLLTTTLTYAGVIALAMIASVRIADTVNVSNVLAGWAAGIMALQAGVLLLFAGSRVVSAIRHDLNGGIIESHRLMPVAPAQAVLGYLFGSTSQALCLAVANLLLGGYASISGGIAVHHWLGANVLLLTFAVFVWVLLAYAAFIPRSPVGLMFFFPILFMGGQGGFLALAPGFTLLATPLLGASVFDMTATVGGLTQGFVVALTGQAVVGALFFVAATRKYRRGDVIGFTPALGIALLASWVALSLIGTAWWDDVAPRFARGNWVEPQIQLLTSLVIAMLLALVPVWSSADEHANWLHRRLAGDAQALRRRPFPAWLIILATAAVALPLVAVADRLHIASFPPQTLPFVALAVVLHVASSSYLRRSLRFYTEKANSLFIVWLLTLWLGPILFDLIRSELNATIPRGPMFGPISCISPVGTMVALASNRIVEVPMGLGVQGLLTVLTALFYYHTHPLRRIRRPRLNSGDDRADAT